MVIAKTFWKNKRVFLTGHTGFKGSWMLMLLEELEVEVCGYALEPATEPALFHEIEKKSKFKSVISDIRNKDKLEKEIRDFKPEIVIHMAAQPLVRQSYLEPLETMEINVMGTANLLDILRNVESVKFILNVTTDKVYKNNEWIWGYRESEQLGGKDPYSASKACAEIVTYSYYNSFFKEKNVKIVTARAGNVIGGGDWSKDRLIPDYLKSLENNEDFVLRNPSSIRPWQHVLEPLVAYLLIIEKLYSKNISEHELNWNVGPKLEDCVSTNDVINQLSKNFDNNLKIKSETNGTAYHEANFLMLDTSKIQRELSWSPRWTLGQSLKKIAEWHKEYVNKSNMKNVTINQIREFLNEQ